MRYFICGFPPVKQVGIPKSLLEDSWGIMINDENVWTFVVNENHFDDFPLASIFDPSVLKLPLNWNIPPISSKINDGGNKTLWE